MKRYLIILIGCCSLWACTKEGLPGPQGPEGPEGPQGEPGSGSSGTNTRLITLFTPTNQVTYTWTETNRTATHTSYRFNWKTGTREGHTFLLPDSLTKYIEEGVLLVYAFNSEDLDRGPRMFQLAYAPIHFHTEDRYKFQLAKVNGRYTISVTADMMEEGDPGRGKPMKLDRLKFVIVPRTERHSLIWG